MKTAELVGDALCYCVAQCEEELDESVTLNPLAYFDLLKRSAFNYLSWAQGGPIIEREGLTVTHHTHVQIPPLLSTRWGAQTDEDIFSYGPTPLIAAMRCYVASKMGDEIEIPKEVL